MIRSLRLKFIAVTMAIVTVFLAVILVFVVRSTADNLRSESIAALDRAAEELPDPGRPGQTVLPCFVVRLSARGQSIQTSGSFDLSDQEMLSDIVAQAAAAEEEIGELEEYSLRYLRRENPLGMTLVFGDISAEKSTLRSLTLTCGGIGIVSLLVFWGVSVLLSKWVTKPVEQAWEEQRRFVADASHELKTPLTVILTNAELLDAENTSQYSRSILTMGSRMRTLIESLLELARLDNGAAKAVFEEVDLSELTEEELLPFEPMYFEHGLTLESHIDADIRLQGSPSHLRQLLTILLDNAMKYSPQGSTVRLRLTSQGSNALLTLVNPGESMTREECQAIFRRFYRVDNARTSGGYGLGLPIAQSIAADHGGKIWAESRDGTITFSVSLPMK